MFRFILLFSIALSYAQTITLADAQKAYLSANWAEAAKLFSTVCPQLEKGKQPECIMDYPLFEPNRTDGRLFYRNQKTG